MTYKDLIVKILVVHASVDEIVQFWDTVTLHLNTAASNSRPTYFYIPSVHRNRLHMAEPKTKQNIFYFFIFLNKISKIIVFIFPNVHEILVEFCCVQVLSKLDIWHLIQIKNESSHFTIRHYHDTRIIL